MRGRPRAKNRPHAHHCRRASKPSPVRPVREIPQFRRLALAVRAGGRCEFDGHNKYLLRHPLTLTEGNFAQVAHIVAFSAGGPRGKHPIARAAQGVNDVRNLMLLCPECHKLIDDHPEQYTVGVLRAYKTKHEKRIEHGTSLRPNSRTTAVVLRGNVAGQKFSLPPGQLHEAVAPRYPESDDPFLIDLSTITMWGRGVPHDCNPQDRRGAPSAVRRPPRSAAGRPHFGLCHRLDPGPHPLRLAVERQGPDVPLPAPSGGRKQPQVA